MNRNEILQKVNNILSKNTSTIINAVNHRHERVIKQNAFLLIVNEITNFIEDEKKIKTKIDRI